MLFFEFITKVWFTKRFTKVWFRNATTCIYSYLDNFRGSNHQEGIVFLVKFHRLEDFGYSVILITLNGWCFF